MVQWVIRSILHGGPILLFLIPAIGMIHIKEPLLQIRKSSPVVATGFLCHYMSGPLPYV